MLCVVCCVLCVVCCVLCVVCCVLYAVCCVLCVVCCVLCVVRCVLCVVCCVLCVELLTTVVPVIFSVSVFPGTVNFGGNTFLSFRGNSFFEKFRGNSFFSSKGGQSVQRGGRGPPFLGKRGLPPIFWGAPAKLLIPKILTEFSFGIGMVNTEKYRPILTKKYRLGKTL
jgi:hypothetical protein